MTTLINKWSPLAIWGVGSAVAIFFAWQWADIVFLDTESVPIGADAFYHSTRILATVADSSEFYEFDSRIHAPEGSWLTWPWGFDRLMALLTSIGVGLGFANSADRILMALPTVWVLVNVGLVVMLSRALKLSVTASLLAVVCYSFLPFTQNLHGVGRVDHHFAEHTLFLLALVVSLKWFSLADSRIYPLALGLILGLAPTVHNGLFILQLPLLVSLFLLWLNGRQIPLRFPAYFSLSILVFTLLGLLPSSPFWQGEFSYYLLSWFHLYVAACTAFAAIYIASVRFSVRTLLIFLFICLLLIAPVLSQLHHGARFLAGSINQYSTIIETQNIVTLFARQGVLSVIENYTGLILILPPILFWQFSKMMEAIQTFNSAPACNGRKILFGVNVLFGGVLMLSQIRFHYLGSVALLFPLFIFLDTWVHASSKYRTARWVMVVPALLLAYVPSLYSMTEPRPVGMDPVYNHTRNIYRVLHDACRNEPGVVLAHWTSGHHIRYHSECSVISNNMILTPQHEEKVLLSERLLRSSSASIRDNEKWIKYVYVVRADDPSAQTAEALLRKMNSGLRWELMLSGKPIPHGFTLLAQVHVLLPRQSRSIRVPVARLFRVDR